MKLLIGLIASLIALTYLTAWLLHIAHWASTPTFLAACFNLLWVLFVSVCSASDEGYL